MKKFTRIILITFIFALSASKVFGALNTPPSPFGPWVKYPGNPVLVDSDAECHFPEVILSEVSDPLRQPIQYPHPTKGMKYWMYYETCWRGGARLAYSSDLIHWTPYENNPILTTSTDELSLFTGVIFKDGSNFYIFYDIIGGIRYASAQSPFGPWTKGPVILTPGPLGSWEEGRVTEPFVFKYDNTYYLYYMGDLVPPYGRKEQVGLATVSASLFPAGPWEKQGLKLPVSPSSWDWAVVADPSIIQVNNIWYMLYTGSGSNQTWSLGMAWSTNPQGPWTKYPEPILSRGPAGTWDNARILRGSIHFFNNNFYLPYAGSDGTNFRGGLATAKANILLSPTPTGISTPTPTPTPTPGSITKTISVNIKTNSDDANQDGDAAKQTRTSEADLKLGWYASYVGLRFTDPQLASLASKQIKNAFLSFSSNQNNNLAINMQISAEASSNCNTFATIDNNIGSRTKTVASTAWPLNTPWGLNQRINTPNIASLLNEVVNRPDYNGGAICILIKYASSTLYYQRLVASYDNTIRTEPSLTVEYYE